LSSPGQDPYDEIEATAFTPAVGIVLAALIDPSALFVIGGFLPAWRQPPVTGR
jgi:hypothetical protein